MVVSSCYLLVVVLVCFSSLGYTSGGLSEVCVIVGVVSILGSGFPSRSFCKAGFVDIYCINLILSLNTLFSPSIVN